MAEAVAANVPATTAGGESKKPLFGLTFLENLSDMSMLRQIGLLVGLAASVAIGFAVVLWSQQPDYRPLYGSLDGMDASQVMETLTAADIMSRDLVTVDPDMPLSGVADLFRQHNFTSLPVVQEGDKFLGIIFQIHLIRRARDDALRLDHLRELRMRQQFLLGAYFGMTVLLTMVALLGLAWRFQRAARDEREGQPARFVARLAAGVNLIGAIAMVFVALPTLSLPPCL